MIFHAGETNPKPQTSREFVRAVFIRRRSLWDEDSEANGCAPVEAKAKETKLATDMKLSLVCLANGMHISSELQVTRVAVRKDLLELLNSFTRKADQNNPTATANLSSSDLQNN